MLTNAVREAKTLVGETSKSGVYSGSDQTIASVKPLRRFRLRDDLSYGTSQDGVSN
jgi:hypothetical protein